MAIARQSQVCSEGRAVAGSGPRLAERTRRQFLGRIICLAAATNLPLSAAERVGQNGELFRAAIIGHTGRGNYGHDHDLIFDGRDNVSVAAVADPDPAGRARAAARAHALRQYADYREMLAAERPQLVCVAPRWTDQHHAMAMAALRRGAHVYVEKPFTQTLAEADELLTVAYQSGLKIAVAHQMRLAPNILWLKQSIADGLIGDLLEIRAHGKQDKRAGGEDLVVLGVHLFDLMRFFAGDPLWCTARVLQNGHDITLQDAHRATEDIGPVAGDQIFAQFAFPKGVNATFTSQARFREVAGPWGMQLVGTNSQVSIQMEMVPKLFLSKNGGGGRDWLPLENDPARKLPETERSIVRANQRVTDDWLAAIMQNREPVCSGDAATKALEMAMAVFAAGVSRGRVEFPLRERGHPLRGQGS